MSLEDLNKLRNILMIIAVALCVLSVTLDGIWQILSASIGVVALVVGNIFNVIYVRKIKQLNEN